METGGVTARVYIIRQSGVILIRDSTINTYTNGAYISALFFLLHREEIH